MMFTRAARNAKAEASSDALSEVGRATNVVVAETGVEIGVAVGRAVPSVAFSGGGGDMPFFGTGDAVACVEVATGVSTTASVDDAFWIMAVGMRGVAALPNIETTKNPMRKTTAMPIWGLRRDMFIRYYQASRDTNVCLHMLVRGKRGEEGWNVLILKMVFSHHAGLV